MPRLDTNSSVNVMQKMRRKYKTGYKNTQEQDCGTIQENQLETCVRLCRGTSAMKECNSVQKFVKKVTHEKECDIGTDHQCKVENVRQCRQVTEQFTVSKKVGSSNIFLTMFNILLDFLIY